MLIKLLFSTKSLIDLKPTIILSLLLIAFSSISFAQCPTVTNSDQSFCDIDDPTIANLVAIDNGNGIQWYDTPSSTTPLSSTTGLENGEDYYADDNTGACGARERVDVTIYGPPFGLNFQGVCVDDPNDATISDLTAIGNNVQWYSLSSGGSALLPSTILNDNTIYYADQENPDTGCRTSRLSVLVNIGVVPVPTGNSVQTFCSENPPTVADLSATGANNWYTTENSVIPLDPSTPLIDGENYFATSTDPPCESNERFEVTVIIESPSNPGSNGFIEICESDINSIGTIDLIDELSDNPDMTGSWTGPFPTSNGSSGTVDITTMTVVGSPYIFTYSVDPGNACSASSSTVTISISPLPNAGTNGSLDICASDMTVIDLFTILGGTPDSGGTWSPSLASSTGLFDPAVDAPGAYTYTVTGIDPCPDASATVTVAIVPEPNAGTNGFIDICNNDATQDLFTALGGSPDSGGTWSPALASGTGLFDPAVDTPGVYTYTVTGTPPCPDASATVTVSLATEVNAGTNGSIDICASDTTVIDLFTILGGTPDSGGTWSPTLASGTGLFDPALDAPGVYTYTVAGTTPCPDASATVTVTLIPEPNAGSNGSIDICNNDATQDLFTALGGSPDLGGTWSPALTSGTGLFDPAVDAPGVYTYTVTGTPPCPDASATVTVALIPEPNAGTNGSIDICASDTTVIDLFTILGGTPDSGGTWSPSLASGTGLFDPALDAPGVYTYTVAGTPPCPDASATVTVSLVPEVNAGTNGSIDICANDTTVIDLFTILGGAPDSGGTWSPSLASGTGLFDPAVDAPGVYTYTVTGIDPCPDASATVTVAIVPEPNAGTNGSIDICNNDATQDLFTALGGSPDSGGTWSPALASGTGLFDPAVDTPGVYTYTVTGTPPCPDASATVTVALIPEPNAGDDGNAIICSENGVQNLFDFISGNPDTGGIWSPSLASGTGIFDPNIDASGIYTYSVGPNQCNQRDSSEITVSIENNADATGLEIQIGNICLGLPNPVQLTGADFLQDGNYTIVYSLTNANNSQNTADIIFTSGSSDFTIPESLLTNVGTTTITIVSLIPENSMCSPDVTVISAQDFIVFDNVTPEIIEEGHVFCQQDEPTIADLTSNINGNAPITWYDAPSNGNVYDDSTVLINGETYYASTLTAEGCESIPRLEVTVLLEDCPNDIIIPDGFSPNGDNINDDFHIVNLREFYPNFTLEIYNRYGNILYKGNIDTPNWDGHSDKGITLGNSILPVGVYFYILKFNDGNRSPIQGRVYLSR